MTRPKSLLKKTRSVHSFGKAISLFSANLEEVHERLLQLTKSTDEKVAKDACKEYIGVIVDMQKHKDDVDMKRVIVQSKMLQLSGSGQQQSNVPVIQFDVIQSCE